MSDPHTQSGVPRKGRSATPEFECTREAGLDAVTLTIRGHLSADTADRLDDALLGALQDARLVVLDLHEVESIDAGAAYIVVRANRAAAVDGRRLVIVRAPHGVDTALKLNGTDGSLTMIDSRGELVLDPRVVGGLNIETVLPVVGAGQVRLICRGEIDTATAPQLRDAIADLAASDLIVDLTDTSFMDSTGLSTLLNALRRLTRQDHRLVIVCPPGAVRNVFGLTAMLETFSVVDDLRAAERVLTR